ncbi:hypothetical protein LO80_09355 [Candidatus Francisella endociliophora]|uniref:Uncharacterized protein n=1 Tax=Candidatus Francisella endociliophora TaxID=653937 RepID=A0A097ERI8_9GAMM|nr:hypothetical protein [Francisella sp. FSC1006]AIT10157.1 hypothetical protein LO80_09355 [Francisella sp. FSC1006]
MKKTFAFALLALPLLSFSKQEIKLDQFTYDSIDPNRVTFVRSDYAMPNIPVVIKKTNGGFPALGKWMIDSDGQVAHWLGDRKINGKKDSRYTLEPINVEFFVKATSELDAFTKVDSFLTDKDTGFGNVSKLHSSGYQAYIGEDIYNQFQNKTYSDNYPFMQNDHLRIFGSTKSYNGYYVMTGSCSEESGLFKVEDKRSEMNNLMLLIHHFVSFNHCRDLLYKNAKKQGINTQYIKMNNTFLDDNFSTRDHDGNAVQIIL